MLYTYAFWRGKLTANDTTCFVSILLQATKLNRTVETLNSELSTVQNKYRQQTEEVNQLQEQGVMLKVELATFQEKCRLTQEEVVVCRFDFE